MVDALGRILRWLPTRGWLIDIHPTPEAAHLEVRAPRGIVSAGDLVDNDDHSGPRTRHAHADAALTTAIAQGWFVLEERREFTFRRYADTLSEMRAYVESKWKGAGIEEATWVSASALMQDPKARLWLRETVSIVRLRPGQFKQVHSVPFDKRDRFLEQGSQELFDGPRS